MQQSSPATKRKRKLVKIHLQKIASIPPPSSGVAGSGNLCLQCGKQNLQRAKFCTNCGTPFHPQQRTEQPPLQLLPYVPHHNPYPASVQAASRRKKPWYRRFLSSGRTDTPTASRLSSLTVQQEREQRRDLLARLRKQRYQQEQERRYRQQQTYSTNEEYREYQ